jgi:hypothetical protein
MKPHSKHIRGSLWPCNAYAISETTATKVRKAVAANNLTKIIKKTRWDFGIIDINNVSLVSRDFSDIRDFIESIENLVNDDQVADLGLEGDIMITVETVNVEPFMYLIKVSKSEVSVKRGEIVWT